MLIHAFLDHIRRRFKMTIATLAPVGYKQPTIEWNGLTVTDLFCGDDGG